MSETPSALVAVRRYEVSSLLFTVTVTGFAAWFLENRPQPAQWLGVKTCKVPGVPNPVERFKVTRVEVADMLRAQRRANLGTGAKQSGQYGVMKQCPRTTLAEWKARR